MDPEVVAKLDEVRKAKGMTPRAVSDEDGLNRMCSSQAEAFAGSSSMSEAQR